MCKPQANQLDRVILDFIRGNSENLGKWEDLMLISRLVGMRLREGRQTGNGRGNGARQIAHRWILQGVHTLTIDSTGKASSRIRLEVILSTGGEAS